MKQQDPEITLQKISKKKVLVLLQVLAHREEEEEERWASPFKQQVVFS